MRLVDRYVLRQIAVPSALAIVVILVVGAANEIQERLVRLPIAQMTLGDISQLTFYFVPALLPYIVPITFMMGILLAFGRLAQNNEIVAMKAAGIPLKRLVAPVIVVGAVLSGLCFVIQDRVQPWASDRVHAMIHSELPLRITLKTLPKGIIQEYGDWRVYVGGENPDTGALEDIVVLEPKEDGRATTYYADAARLVTENGQTTLEMTNVHFIPPSEKGYVTPFRTDSFRLPLPTLGDSKPNTSPEAMTVRELYLCERATLDEVERTHSEPSKRVLLGLRLEIANRLAVPFACLAVTFAAAPLGARARRSGRSYTFAVGFAVMLVYYVLHVVTTPKALCSLGTAVMLGWSANLALIAAGGVFLWRIDRV